MSNRKRPTQTRLSPILRTHGWPLRRKPVYRDEIEHEDTPTRGTNSATLDGQPYSEIRRFPRPYGGRTDLHTVPKGKGKL
jgi:hypothetical protein